MKLRIYSDLHLEFAKFKPQQDPSPDTILVLAGDIGVKLGALSFIEKQAPKYKAVIYVMGNHEYYNSNMNTTVSRWRSVSHIPNLFVLDDDAVTIDGVRFLGGTLWSDLNNDDFAVKQNISLRLNDYQCIAMGKPHYSAGNTKFLTPSMTVALHRQTLAFYKKELETSKIPTIIVSHHSPSSMGCDLDKYGVNNMANYAYYTPLEDFMGKYAHLTHWIFGHTHKSLDIDIHGTRVLSNPRGYVGHQVNDKFNPNMEIEI